MKKISLLFIFTCLISFGKVNQLASLPFIKNYKSTDYNTSQDNWAVIQDNDGLVFVGNTTAILMYDGINWIAYFNQNASIVRSLAVGKNNEVYVGSEGEIGVLEPVKNERKYKSLNYLLPENYKFKEVWKTYRINDAIVFQTNTELFFLRNNKISIIKPQKENSFHFSYVVNDEFYVLEKGAGLMKLKNGKLQLVNQTDYFKNDKLYALMSFHNDSMLAVFRESGAYLIHKNGGYKMFDVENKPQLQNAFVYGGVKINDKHFALATINDGLFIYNNKGQIVNHFNKSNGLQDQFIKGIFKDNQNGLWLALDNGISRIDLNMGLTLLPDYLGYEGKIESICEYNGYLYCATSRGLFYAEIKPNKVPQFIKFNEINLPCFSLDIIEASNKKVLLVSSQNGLFQVEKSTVKFLLDEHVYAVGAYKKNNTIFIATKSGLIECTYDNNELKNITFLDEINYEIRKIVSDNFENVWLGTSFDGVLMLPISKKFSPAKFSKKINSQIGEFYLFDENSGLMGNRFNIPFSNDKEGIIISGIKGTVIYDYQNKRFIKNYANNLQLPYDSVQVTAFIRRNQEEYFLSYNFNTITKSHFVKHGKMQLINPLDNVKTYSVSHSSNHYYLLATSKGIYVYNPFYDIKPEYKFQSFIRFLDAGKKRIIDFYKSVNNITTAIEYSNNYIVFGFSANAFYHNEFITHSYYLEGLENDFSPFKNENKVEYRNLKEGKYIFHVKSKDVYNRVSIEDSISFEIMPPWYRTTFAYFLYLILFIFFIYVAIKISVYRLQQAKNKLEKIVEIRTEEIREQKNIVEVQKKIVEGKNKDITDSISYAKRIQEAILPLKKEIQYHFPESFILYQPRDIVSGDFYWFSKPNSDYLFFAVVDCTGHGVPGAFMSMIGNTVLNEIVNEKQIFNTDEILNNLHDSIRAVLKQNQADTDSRDGMDIALFRWEKSSRKLQFSGANRSLYYISQNKLFELKADKFPIGGVLFEKEDKRIFSKEEIMLNENTMIYAFSDGFPDQFGGEFGKKYMVKKLKENLLDIHHLSPEQQLILLENKLKAWMKSHEQIDDILLIGIKV